MTPDTIITLVFSTIGGGIISAAGTIVTYKNYKKGSSDSDRNFSLEQMKEVADRQIDAHKEEVKMATNKLQDTISQLNTAKKELEANRAEIEELHQKTSSMRVGYERKIKALEVENRQLRSRCRYLENKVTELKKERK